VVGKREVVALDVVASRRHVPRQAACGLAPPFVREELVHERERPERLAGPVGPVLARNRALGRPAPGAEHTPVILLLGKEEASKLVQERVLARVSGGQPPLDERRGDKRAGTESGVLTRLRERGPVIVPQEICVEE
jgi:hypothetical protein